MAEGGMISASPKPSKNMGKLSPAAENLTEEVSTDDWLNRVFGDLAIQPILTKHLTVANKMLLESVNDTMANLLLRNYWPGEQELCVRCLNVECLEVNGIEFRNATLETAISQLLKRMQVVKKADIRIFNNVFIPGLKDLLLRAMKAMAIENLLFATYPFYLGLAAGLIQQARNSLKTVEVDCYANWTIRMPEDADYSDCSRTCSALWVCASY